MGKGNLAVWVIGSEGMLGKEISELLESRKIFHCGTGMDCDITDMEALLSFSRGKKITHIINCAGYTAVERAEEEPEKAYSLNALGPKNIAEAANAIRAVIVHISTDYVFDGKNMEGYKEDAPVNPVSVYGRTKAYGELFVQNDAQKFYIVRTSWLYGIHGSNFVNTMLKLMNERDEVLVVDDQHGSPTYTCDLARFILFLIETKKTYGIYHFSNLGVTTWHGFAREIYKIGRKLGLIDSECVIKSINSAEYPSKAARPKYSKLLQGKSPEYPNNHWQKSLLAFLERLNGL